MVLKTKEFEESFVDNLFNLLRITTNSNEEIIEKYNHFCEIETLSNYQKKYFNKLVFGNISYFETKKKMLKLLSSNIKNAEFAGKEIKNMQRFFREQKLNKLGH